jgi:carbon-monoxide dehydrogenase large subunit
MAKFVGNRSRSKEGPRHVTGKGLFTDDFTMPGMLQAMILRSPHAHAKILSVDPSEALRVEGQVFTFDVGILTVGEKR